MKAKKRILLVDDDVSLLRVTEKQLTDAGYEVTAVPSAEAALEAYSPEYVDLVVRFLERLPPSVVIQRFTGEAPRHLTVAPDWSVNKLAVMNAIERELERRNTWQGRCARGLLEDLRTPAAVPGAPAGSAPR